MELRRLTRARLHAVNRLIDANKLPHLLLYGPPGTGKTSTILACARRLYGEKFQAMTLELNASDDRGIDVVRDQIKNFAGTRKLFSTGVKLVILDEADAMSADAQFALRRGGCSQRALPAVHESRLSHCFLFVRAVIEKFTKNTRFCLICNYVSKIIPALQSRCTRFRFAPLHRSQIQKRFEDIVRAESVDITEDGSKAILDLSGGDMRKVLNILQSTALSFGKVTEINVYQCTGEPLPSDIETIIDMLLNATFREGFDGIAKMQREKGLALVDVLDRVSKSVYEMELPQSALGFILARLADIEYRLAFGTSERLQLASMVGAFHRMRDILSKM